VARRGRPPITVTIADGVRAELQRRVRAATSEQRLEIVARACELIVRPNETPEDGNTRTIEELMDEVIRRGIVPDIRPNRGNFSCPTSCERRNRRWLQMTLTFATPRFYADRRRDDNRVERAGL
jgi:hypothetical protein